LRHAEKITFKAAAFAVTWRAAVRFTVRSAIGLMGRSTCAVGHAVTRAGGARIVRRLQADLYILSDA
jgi:hypothetical protein